MTTPALSLAAFGESLDNTTRPDLFDRPTLDVEAQALCALLWSTPETAKTVVAHLAVDDFYQPVYGELYAVIARLVDTGKPHSAPLTLAVLEQTGRAHGKLSAAVLNVTLADARGHDAAHLAYAVMAQSYRRGYTVASTRLAQLAEEADTDELYEEMCVLGRERRTAHARLVAAGGDLS